MKRLAVTILLLALGTSVGCDKSKHGESSAPARTEKAPDEAEEAAPPPAQKEREADSAAADSEAEPTAPGTAPSGLAACPSADCRKACGEYSGDDAGNCVAAYRAGCFGGEAGDFDCGKFGEKLREKEKADHPRRRSGESQKREAPPSLGGKAQPEGDDLKDKASPRL